MRVRRKYKVPKLNLAVVIASLPFLLLVIFPKGGLISITYLVPLVFLISGLVISYKLTSNVTAPTKMLFICSLFLICGIIFFTSIFINQTFSERAILNGLKFLFFSAIFLSAYVVSVNISESSLVSSFKLIAIVVILLQLILVSITIFHPTFFDFMWSSDKTRGIGQTLRLTGSMYNPNTFGLMILNLYAVIIFLSRPYLKTKVIFTSICLLLILLSGSRTSVILFVIFMPIILVISRIENLNIKSVLKSSLLVVGLMILLVYLLFVFLETYGGTFRYIARITQLEYQNFGVLALSVAEQSGRYSSWVVKWEHFASAPGIAKWFIGLGVDDVFRLGDNDYFYSFWHWGALGALASYLVYVSVISLCPKANRRQRATLLIIFLQLAAFGIMIETFFSWFHPILYWVLAGVAYGSAQKRKLKYLCQKIN